eukprot:774163-Amphidinium_carterae.1
MHLRKGDNGWSWAWNTTTMYAYGGLASVAGIHHACLLGLPAQREHAIGFTHMVASELATWWSSSILVNTSLVLEVMWAAYDILSRAKSVHDRNASSKIKS